MGAPEGKCLGNASTSSEHPYICDACEALRHGRHSQLNRKLQRAGNLRHPRSEEARATKSGVNHKHCSKQQLQNAIQIKQNEKKTRSQKVVQLSKANHNSWTGDPTLKSFFRTLLNLMHDHKLYQFDLSFLSNWVGKKMHGRNHYADEPTYTVSW